ncbi:MAG TPA: SAM-dependent methyltransferase [Thermodesulfobacteriota bacterium]|nr:SAM-dependent methyltransferase [Thermodesulfobacteriota bacterium]
MKKKLALPLFSLSIFFLCFLTVSGWTASSPTISITGSVRQPLNLTLQDLQRLETVTVRLNEVTMDHRYNGAFYFRGVPLKTLLELAYVEKEETGFSKLSDLAIVVRNKEGKQTVLSWGEVFSSNPGEVVLAFSSAPIIPHADCKICHGPEVFQSRLDILSRRVGLPKLVVANDFYTDRSLEDVTNIEVADLHLKMPYERTKDLFSPGFTVTGEVRQTLNISDLAPYPRTHAPAKMIGDGAGYHGLETYGGVLLSELLKKAGVTPDTNQVVIISAPDGYRTLLSYGEVFLSSRGKSILIADQAANQPVKKDGKFKLILPDDLSADRTVKAVSKIEVISLKPKSNFYIIGMGCADTNLITLEAISVMGKADVFICPEDIQKRFGKYMGNKPVLFETLKHIEHLFNKDHPNLSPEEKKKLLEEQNRKDIQSIRNALKAGKTVAFLEYGDPTLYPSWMHWLGDLSKEAHYIPGISAFNAANAMIGKHLGCNGSIIITVPQGLKTNEAMLKAVADNGDTLVIFIGLKELKNLKPLFQKYYANTTPVHLVYRAGYSDSGYIVKTTVAEVAEVAEKEPEKHLGMIYIGPCLK